MGAELTQWENLTKNRLSKIIQGVRQDSYNSLIVTDPMLIAVALAESNGTGYYSCGSCGEDREAVARAVRLVGCTSHDAKAVSRVDRGIRKGQQGKFYVDEQNVNFAARHCGEWQIKNRGMVALASSWGTWQQTMRWYLPQFDKGTWYERFNEFLASETIQAEVAMRFLHKCLKNSNGCVIAAFGRYNAGEAAEKWNTAYAIRTYNIYNKFIV